MSVVFYHQAERKPHRSRYGLNAAPDEAADATRAEVTDLSLHAQALRAAGERVVSTDAMTGVQALERTPPPIPMGPGRAERRECADSRRGPLTFIAHFDVAQGPIVRPSLGPTRTAEDFWAHIPRTVDSDPQATRWPCVADHLHMHQSESLVRFVAEHDGITDNLGNKEQHGMLQSRATRAALLADPTPRMVFHSTPNHASWLHQIAMWCSIVVRKLLKRASFTSVEDWQTQVLACIVSCNATMAQPFQWTYGRKPLSV
jgi:hypothetical protein